MQYPDPKVEGKTASQTSSDRHTFVAVQVHLRAYTCACAHTLMVVISIKTASIAVERVCEYDPELSGHS